MDINVGIIKSIMHIMDRSVSEPVYSDYELNMDFLGEFIGKHIGNFLNSPDVKAFDERYNEDMNLFFENIHEDFIEASKKMTESIFYLINNNDDVPAGDALYVLYEKEGELNFIMLLLEYKTGYIHKFGYENEKMQTEIIEYKTCLTNITQKVSNVFNYSVGDGEVKILEKQYKVDGAKTNFLSQGIFNLEEKKTVNEKLNIVRKTAEKLINEYYEDDIEKHKDLKTEIIRDCIEKKEVDIEKIAEKIFEGDDILIDNFNTHISNKGLKNEPIKIDELNYNKILKKQKIKTKEGIELLIPIDLMTDSNKIAFEQNDDGTTNIILRNLKEKEE
ncbi:hypothetical protein SAMN02745751_00890 [Dethiosulfatibacter aminovorans DSM 17477]|uniref:Nucleoid associated protein NdpA n=1 Tax=Dethiosulfatibacter aminovorans DSM 17477 TaxID=1121476 RepID=A0A1M6DFP5_9FIRM|nr:nucleoid-associated protein [Dethiosulfatibacter aminovorans]SHI71808.1 hypothetical protein SAMN02745751_00890 [Dethiosulfatibacter aminovorans DSM 17477]